MILRARNNKTIAILFIVVVCFGYRALASEERIYIEGGKVGNIAVGMDISPLIKKHPTRFKKIFIEREGNPEPAFIYRFNNGKSITLDVNEGKGIAVIWGITVEDPYFKTRKDIGVGNTFTEVKKAYPNAVFDATQEEGKSIGLIENGFAFLFDISQIKDEWWLQKDKDINALKNVKVNMITIFQRDRFKH